METKTLKESFALRFKMLRTETGLTQNQLIEDFCIKMNRPEFTNKASLSQYENAKRIPDVDVLVLWAKYFNVTVDYLLGLSDTRIKHFVTAINELEKMIKGLSEDDKILARKYMTNINKMLYKSNMELAEEPVPYVVDVLGQTAAGSPISYADEGSFSAKVSNVPQGADYALVVNGDSMEPLIANNSIIYVHKQEDVENGTIGVIEIDNAVTCKKVYKENGKLKLVSLNKKYDDMIFESGNIRILGKVILP